MRSTLLNTTMDRKGNLLPHILSKLFGDILATNHVCKIPRPETRTQTSPVVIDAQGAILVLQRVKDLAKKGDLAEIIGVRARQVRTALKDLFKNEWRDTSLEGFYTKQSLNVIEKNHGQRCVEGCAVTNPLENAEAGAAQRRATEGCLTKASHESRQDASKQCANIKCKATSSKFISVSTNSKAGQKDWSAYYGEYLCLPCYARHKLHGGGKSTGSESEHIMAGRSNLKAHPSVGHMLVDSQKDGLAGSNNKTFVQAQSDSLQRSNSMQLRSTASRGKKSKKLPASKFALHGSKNVGVKDSSNRVHKPVVCAGKICQCGRPFRKGGTLVTKGCKAGNQEWSQCVGMTLCFVCYQTYSKYGTLSCSKKSAPKADVQPDCGSEDEMYKSDSRGSDCSDADKEIVKKVMRDKKSGGGRDLHASARAANNSTDAQLRGPRLMRLCGQQWSNNDEVSGACEEPTRCNNIQDKFPSLIRGSSNKSGSQGHLGHVHTRTEIARDSFATSCRKNANDRDTSQHSSRDDGFERDGESRREHRVGNGMYVNDEESLGYAGRHNNHNRHGGVSQRHGRHSYADDFDGYDDHNACDDRGGYRSNEDHGSSSEGPRHDHGSYDSHDIARKQSHNAKDFDPYGQHVHGYGRSHLIPHNDHRSTGSGQHAIAERSVRNDMSRPPKNFARSDSHYPGQRNTVAQDENRMCGNPQCTHKYAEEFYRIRSHMFVDDLGNSALVGDTLCNFCYHSYKATGAFDSGMAQYPDAERHNAQEPRRYAYQSGGVQGFHRGKDGFVHGNSTRAEHFDVGRSVTGEDVRHRNRFDRHGESIHTMDHSFRTDVADSRVADRGANMTRFDGRQHSTAHRGVYMAQFDGPLNQEAACISERNRMQCSGSDAAERSVQHRGKRKLVFENDEEKNERRVDRKRYSSLTDMDAASLGLTTQVRSSHSSDLSHELHSNYHERKRNRSLHEQVQSHCMGVESTGEGPCAQETGDARCSSKRARPNATVSMVGSYAHDDDDSRVHPKFAPNREAQTMCVPRQNPLGRGISADTAPTIRSSAEMQQQQQCNVSYSLQDQAIFQMTAHDLQAQIDKERLRLELAELQEKITMKETAIRNMELQSKIAERDMYDVQMQVMICMVFLFVCSGACECGVACECLDDTENTRSCKETVSCLFLCVYLEAVLEPNVFMLLEMHLIAV
jgi:hypothetical protein